ncbi:hypothetical protein BTHERMOSOX_1965 [Bathymodiolus thermophilus thioautotrophic gill symbiont]|nr:hypothetical protein BTHERMOSOX_1965 [Bathymodiolus thermophilus thioautotrophic gill symbiont]
MALEILLKPSVKYIAGIATIAMIIASSVDAHNRRHRLAKINLFSTFSCKAL